MNSNEISVHDGGYQQISINKLSELEKTSDKITVESTNQQKQGKNFSNDCKFVLNKKNYDKLVSTLKNFVDSERTKFSTSTVEHDKNLEDAVKANAGKLNVDGVKALLDEFHLAVESSIKNVSPIDRKNIESVAKNVGAIEAKLNQVGTKVKELQLHLGALRGSIESMKASVKKDVFSERIKKVEINGVVGTLHDSGLFGKPSVFENTELLFVNPLTKEYTVRPTNKKPIVVTKVCKE